MTPAPTPPAPETDHGSRSSCSTSLGSQSKLIPRSSNAVSSRARSPPGSSNLDGSVVMTNR